MTRFKSAIVPALLAMSLLGAGMAFAGPPSHGKNDGGNDGPSHNKGGDNGGGNGDNGGGRGNGGGGGGGYVTRKVVICVINGQVHRVRNIHECLSGQVYVKRERKAPRRVAVRKRSYSYGDDVVIGAGGFVGSTAAVSQARRRASKNGGEGGYYAGGLGYGTGGHGYGGTYTYSDSDIVQEPRSLRKRYARKHRRAVYVPVYDPGVVYHTGPIITKSGGD
jgi:hypothetical protein